MNYSDTDKDYNKEMLRQPWISGWAVQTTVGHVFGGTLLTTTNYIN